MEELLSKSNSVPVLLAAICVILFLHAILKIGEIIWDSVKKKSELSEQSIQKLTSSVEHLECTIREVQKDLSEVPKLKTDLRRVFMAVKMLAGEDWADIRKEMMNGDLDL